MIKCLLAVAAASIIRDADTNNVSLIQILEQINAHTFPIAISPLNVLFLLHRDTDDLETADLRFIVVSGENELASFETTADFEGKPRSRILISLQGLAVPNPGPLFCQLRSGDKVLGEWQITVVKIGGPDVQARQG